MINKVHIIDYFSLLLPGLVVEVGKSGLTKQNKQARVTSTFQEMTVWNYDREPSDTDPWHQALSWSKVAAVIHED